MLKIDLHSLAFLSMNLINHSGNGLFLKQHMPGLQLYLCLGLAAVLLGLKLVYMAVTWQLSTEADKNSS